MSSHHQAEQPLLQAATMQAVALITNGNGGARQASQTNGLNGNGEVAAFYDQQTGQIVQALPITGESAVELQRQRVETIGAAAPIGPQPQPGDWVITQRNGLPPRQTAIANAPDFLRRYYPANETAWQLRNATGQVPGGAGAGAVSGAVAPVTDITTT